MPKTGVLLCSIDIELIILIYSSQTAFGNSFKDAKQTALLRRAEGIPKWNLGTRNEEFGNEECFYPRCG
jgi:hypothetical protein